MTGQWISLEPETVARRKRQYEQRLQCPTCAYYSAILRVGPSNPLLEKVVRLSRYHILNDHDPESWAWDETSPS